MKYLKHIEKGKTNKIWWNVENILKKCKMMLKKIKILKMSSYVWESLLPTCAFIKHSVQTWQL